MSIERSSNPAATKASASGEASHVKGKTHPAGQAGAPDTSGFLSILMTLGSDEAGGSVVGLDPAVPTTSEGALPDPGLLLAQSQQLLTELPLTTGNRVIANAEVVVADAELQSVKASVNRGASALSLKPDPAQTGKADLLATDQGPVKEPRVGEATVEAIKELTRPDRDTVKPHVSGPPKASSAMDSMTALARSNRLSPDEARIAQSSSLPQLIQAAGIGEPGLKQTERIAERQALKQIGGYEGGAWGHQALVEAGRIDPPTATTGAADLTPEMRVAEQVNYWINRDVQNAELKLDGMGEGIVKVNISLHGNEARVEFRTDEVATRQVLEGAVSHLKDLLGNEGLVLSGFSVGTSGSGAAASQDGKSRQGTRQTFIEVPEVMATEAGSGPVRLTGRTVDLYV